MENTDLLNSHNYAQECIIHNISIKLEDKDHLISPKDYESWKTLLNAANVRNHLDILKIAETLTAEEIPKVLYHKKCRSQFIMKRDLEILKRKAEINVNDEVGPSGFSNKRPKRQLLSKSTLYDKLCIFCEKVKYHKGKTSTEKLIKATELRVDQNLRKCAVNCRDDKIIALTCRDVVAAEAYYHASCYKNYTRNMSKAQKNDIVESQEKSFDQHYHQIEKLALNDLFTYIRRSIFPNKQIVLIKTLIGKLQDFMKSRGICELKVSTKKHIRRNLEANLGDHISIICNHEQNLVIVPHTVKIKDVVRENQLLKSELASFNKNLGNINNHIDVTSAYIRSMIKSAEKTSPWPYRPTDIDPKNFTVPDYLQRFFIGLLTGRTDNASLTDRVNMLVTSFSQDIIYAVTCGREKPPKHFLLPYAVKTLTGNVEIITTLNRLGHGVSYSQLEENDTALCLQKLGDCSVHETVIPSNIYPNVFTNLAWDNIDRLEETLTGKGTSHRVNGIAVQAKVYGPHLPILPSLKVEKLKQRSVTIMNEELSVYIAGDRNGPQPLITVKERQPECIVEASAAQYKNLIWIIARQIHTLQQKIPSWTGFNIIIRNSITVSQDSIGYLPTINAPATNLTTVFEILNQSEKIRCTLKLKKIVVVMDQALYAKAAEIVWNNRETFTNIIIRMGTFHTICNFLSILGKRFQDAGLRDICIESGILAHGSCAGVFDGKMYNRAVRVHKCIYEAMMRLIWLEFQSWIEVNHSTKENAVQTFLNDVIDLGVEDLNENSIETILQSEIYTEVQDLWNTFLEYLRHRNGDLSCFWMSYIDMVEGILLNLLRASREGNWHLHLHAIKSMIPWCFAYDKMNYARYLPVYYAQMTMLPIDNPDVHQNFIDGYFSVQLSGTNTFGRIPVDQAIEVTVNKDTQTMHGTRNFSLKAGAVKRYYITAEYRSSFLHQLRDLLQCHSSDSQHSDLHKTRITMDEKFTSSVMMCIQSWVNPFTMKEDLIILSTGKKANQDVATDLKRALETGEHQYNNFIKNRLEKNPPTTKFHDPIKQNKLKTFSSMSKKQVVKSIGRTTILKSDRALFGRIIVTAQVRNLQMANVLSYSLGPLPWSLATQEGFLRKTVKSTLANYLQKDVPLAEKITTKCATIIDGMSLVQKLRGDQTNFGEIAMDLLSMVLKEGRMSQRIDVVFDTYAEMSIKNNERRLRGEDSGLQLKSITEAHIVRQWRDFLKGSINKTNLISFIVNEWKKAKYRELLKEQILLVTCKDLCYQITNYGYQEISELGCNHEEADGRLLLHALHAGNEGYKSVIVCSEDTDVFILCLGFYALINVQLFQKCNTKSRTKLIDIGKIFKHVGENVCHGLIGLHAYTGCDTVSTFAGKGKVKALKFMMINEEAQNIFSQLGKEWDLSEELMQQLEMFTCHWYASSSSTTNINDLRYQLFCAKKGEIESHQLPPCRDSLKKHAQRANYQSALWKRSLEKDIDVPTPVGRGWKLAQGNEKNDLVIDWMDGQPAPQAVLDLLACSCRKSCELQKCECLKSGLKCTDMCKLTTCDNQATDEDGDCSFSEEHTDDNDFYGFSTSDYADLYDFGDSEDHELL